MESRRAVKSTSSKKRRNTDRTLRTRNRAQVKKPNHTPVPVLTIPDVIEFEPEPDKGLRFDAIIDRRIIEGMLHDRAGLMAEMDARGLTDAAVLRRAAELGLSEALIRQVKGVAADLAGERPGRRSPPPSLGARTCLCCDRVFLSAGPSNRLCMRCRGGDAGLAQL